MVPRSVALFCAAALGASVVSAGLVWALMAMLAGAGIDFFLSWLTTVLLGMLIVTPPIVMLARMLGTHAMSRTSTAMRSEEHTSELQSLMRISYAVFCLKKKIYDTAILFPRMNHMREIPQYSTPAEHVQ